MIKRLLLVTCFLSLLFSSCQKSLKDIIAQTEKATFIIYTFDDFGTPNGSGSGFFIDEEGTGITSYHVLDGTVKAIIKRSDSLIFEIDTIILSDEQWDIVKFKVANKNHVKFDYLKIADDAPEKGDQVYSISSPLGLEATVSEGIVSSLRKDHHGDIVQVTAPISPGSSGSALLNEKGEVFAVATFQGGGQNLNFGVAFTHQRMDQLDIYHRDRAFGEMEQGEVEDATSLFSYILDESPEDVQALNAMGIFSSINDEDENADYYFSQAIEYHPTNSMSYLNRYETRRKLKNYKEALDDINHVLTLDSVQPDNYVYRAIEYIDMEEWDKAIADWNKAISTEDFKNDPIAYYYRAFCQKSAGRYNLARKDIQTAYKSTTDPELKKDLRDLYVECGGSRVVNR